MVDPSEGCGIQRAHLGAQTIPHPCGAGGPAKSASWRGTLTATGKDLHAKIQSGVGAATAKLYEPFGPADLQATVTILQEVTPQAQALLYAWKR